MKPNPFLDETNSTTVGRYCLDEGVTIEGLSELSDRNAYWDNSYAFVSEKWGTAIDNLSPKQFDWLEKIINEFQYWEACDRE